MDRQEAGEILNDRITPVGGLYDLHCYINWDIGDKDPTLDGVFEAEELEAIAWWMKNKNSEEEEKKDERGR